MVLLSSDAPVTGIDLSRFILSVIVTSVGSRRIPSHPVSDARLGPFWSGTRDREFLAVTGGWATGSVNEPTTSGRMFVTSPTKSSDPFLGQRSKRKVIRCSIRRSPRASVQGTTECEFFLIRAWRSPLGNKEALAREGAEARRFPADSRANKSINPVVREREPLENPLHIGVESHGK